MPNTTTQWAVLDISEGNNYGRILSTHESMEAAVAAEKLLRPATPTLTSVLHRLMSTVAQVEGDIGERVRFRASAERIPFGWT